MRWWAGAWAVIGVVALAACGTSGGGGGQARHSASGSPSGSSAPAASAGTSAGPSSGSPTTPSASGSANPSPSPTGPASPAHCVAGHTQVTVAPGDPVERRLCVRPGTVVTLLLRPRVDDKRWTAVNSSAPVFVVASGWRTDADGSAHASLRSAGTRGGTAQITATAKAPDVAGAARVVFTLHVNVVPYPAQA